MLSHGRALTFIALLALVPFSWLAWQRSYVHRGRLDPTEPVYTSNVLEARGYVFPWLITEVPPAVAPVPLAARIMPVNLLILYLVALCPIALAWGIFALLRGWLRRRPAGSPTPG